MKKHGINTQFYAGGVKGSATQQPTLSESGWISTLTGVWVNQHNVRYNGDVAKHKYNLHIPTIYNKIKFYFPSAITASYTDWVPIAIVARYKYHSYSGADINLLYQANSFAATSMTDRNMTRAIIKSIQGPNSPNFIFVHYNNPDDTGHIKGFSPDSKAYVAALINELYNANSLIKVINKQSNPWLVIITTDHGGHDKTHGTQLPVDRQIFAIIGTNHGKSFVNNKKLGQTAFTQIVLKYLRTGSL